MGIISYGNGVIAVIANTAIRSLKEKFIAVLPYCKSRSLTSLVHIASQCCQGRNDGVAASLTGGLTGRGPRRTKREKSEMRHTGWPKKLAPYEIGTIFMP